MRCGVGQSSVIRGDLHRRKRSQQEDLSNTLGANPIYRVCEVCEVTEVGTGDKVLTPAPVLSLAPHDRLLCQFSTSIRLI